TSRRHSTTSFTAAALRFAWPLAARLAAFSCLARHCCLHSRSRRQIYVTSVALDARLDRCICEHRVHLPRRSVRVGHPRLVLDGVATVGRLPDIRIESLVRQPQRCRPDLLGCLHLHAQMVKGSGYSLTTPGWALDEDELERWFGDGEVGVAGAAL